MTFSELRAKEVINICDGRRLGRASDICLDESARAIALILPGETGWRFPGKSRREDVIVPWDRIRRIGDDVILVEVLHCEAEN